MFTIYRPSDSEAAHKIYPSCLSRVGFGYALWHPEPHSTGEPQIGDVGYVREGAFVRLFNVNISASQHQVTSWTPKFEITSPLPLKVFQTDKRHAPIGPGRFPSRGVEEVEIHGELTGGVPSGGSATLSASYGCKEIHGALLVLKSHAFAESLYDNRELETYIVREHGNWHAYARDYVGHRVEPKDIVLVSGWVKAPADWATAAFSNSNVMRQLSIGEQFAQFVGLSLSRLRTRAYSGPPMERRGARYPNTAGPGEPPNQCIFVKRYKIKKRAGIVRVILAGSGHDNLRTGDRDDRADSGPRLLNVATPTEEGGLFSKAQVTEMDPLDILLEYILEVSEAQSAIARDEDLESILGGDVCPIDLSTYLRWRQPPVSVDDAYGRISLQNLLYRDHERLLNPRITASDLVRWPHITMKGSADVRSGTVELPMDGKKGKLELSNFVFLQFSNNAGNAGPRRCLAISLDGSLMAAESWTSQHIVIWRTSDGLMVDSLPLQGPTSRVTAICFSPDARLAFGTPDNILSVCDVIPGASRARFEGHKSHITTVTFSPRDDRLASCSSDGEVILWDLSSGSPSYRFVGQPPMSQLVFDPQGLQLAAVFRSQVVVFRIRAQISKQATIPFTATQIRATASFSPSGDRIALAYGASAGIYTTSTAPRALGVGENGKTTTFAVFSPDGRAIASISGEGGAKRAMVKDTSTGDVKLKIPCVGDVVEFSPDGRFVAVPYGRTIVVHSAQSGERIALLKDMSDQDVTDLRFLSDSRRLLFVGATGPIGIVNVADTLRVR
ncbi:WD40 repeat domain-containing protein [Phanerochaete sordida]|uniref:WD40 repeat domain-containing protein n=1 Tax=Phanerochaete sordida TaxID=48140 RepID=A0A9P3LHM2_9APHY|nr:WD40 repeat domain-containing protein [Phanerochaete sordida]